MLKRLLAIFSLFVMLYNTAGYYIAFQVFHRQVRKQVWKPGKRHIPRQQLVLIKEKKELLKNGKSRLQFIDQGKEIKTETDLYDIVLTEDVGDEIHFFCVNDRQEQELLAQLEKKVQEDRGEPASNSKALLKSLVKDYLPVYASEPVPLIHFEKNLNPAQIQGSPSCGYLSVNEPPPDSFSGLA